MDRKRFLKTSVTMAALGLTGNSMFLESCSKSNLKPGDPVNFTLDLSSTANNVLNNSGGFVISHNVIVINDGGTYLALSDICTHQGCSVSYKSSNKELVCPCHRGVFDLTGNVLGGPPSAPLKKYTVTKHGNILTVIG